MGFQLLPTKTRQNAVVDAGAARRCLTSLVDLSSPNDNTSNHMGRAAPRSRTAFGDLNAPSTRFRNELTTDLANQRMPLLFSVLPAILGIIAALMVMNLGGPWHDATNMGMSAVFARLVTGGISAAWARGLQNGCRGIQAAPFAVSEEGVRLPSGRRPHLCVDLEE